MKSQTEEQKTNETKKPRFKIEKLEERIAPGSLKHPGPHGHGPGGGGGGGVHCYVSNGRGCFVSVVFCSSVGDFMMKSPFDFGIQNRQQTSARREPDVRVFTGSGES